MQYLLVEPKKSLILTGFILLLHIAALCVVLLCYFPTAVAPLLCLVWAVSLWRTLWQHSFQESQFIKKIHWGRRQGWYLVTKQHTLESATLLASSYVTRYLVILHFKVETGRRRVVVLFPDALEKDTFRQLRVLLRTMVGA